MGTHPKVVARALAIDNGRLCGGRCTSARMVALCLSCRCTIAASKGNALLGLQVTTDTSAHCRKALGQAEGAIEDYQAALKLQPNNKEAAQALQDLQASKEL